MANQDSCHSPMGFPKNVSPTPSKNCSIKVSFDFKAPFILGLPNIQLTYLIDKNNMNSAQNPCDSPWACLPRKFGCFNYRPWSSTLPPKIHLELRSWKLQINHHEILSFLATSLRNPPSYLLPRRPILQNLLYNVCFVDKQKTNTQLELEETDQTYLVPVHTD